ncbi:SDR family NAD(P)-dependent oxidoreductase [Actinoplanes friuliensis]|jgi:short-subunit dehydrogenase|uniref:Short-chain dehydrogenase/reductase SDR n=1 Tax=Actinoplanes friuliensis DSM 7358 TaxID=1246995 RepID=U5W878_9ACTN|nr:SDR family NAD(P)-dependent oxidoreductase [Actinoplanes friuliensis]AGZ45212.1 short-chain dehydrogenase/reductase SDR [Actinoplanes friuliensis DSM 7358]
MPVVIITGASSGIGRAAALRLGRPGTTLVLAARREAELAKVAAEIEAAGGTAVAVPTDVADPAQITALADRAGRVDVLINNAGVGGSPSVLTDDATVTAMVDVNLLAPIRLMRAVIPGMRAAGSGSIINIGSVAGEIGISGTYSATKFALRGMNDSVRRELAGTGIGVTLIEPGHIATELTAYRKGRMPGPEIVVDAIEKAIRRPRRRIVVPFRYRLAMAAASALPQVTDRSFAGKAARKS